MKSDDLVMFNGKECDSEKLEALLNVVLPSVCRVVEEMAKRGCSSSDVHEAALTTASAITTAISIKSLAS